MLSLCLRAARVFGKDCLRQLLATVENITNVKSNHCLLIVIHTSLISNIPGVHNMWQTSLLLCAQRQSLLGMNKIGLFRYQPTK